MARALCPQVPERYTPQYSAALVHLANTEPDMWAALTAGCFLGAASNTDYQSELVNWWHDDQQPITVQSVVKDWRIAEDEQRRKLFDAAAASTLNNVDACLGAAETVLKNGGEVLAIVRDHLTSRHTRMTEVRNRFLDVLKANAHYM